MIMGILGIVTTCCCFIGVIFGCLGTIFALISKKGERFKNTALAGLILSIIALVLAVVVGILMLSSGAYGGIY